VRRVSAAPRAILVQKPSTSLGVTRTSSTGGKSATYSDQLLKSSSGRIISGSGSRADRLRSRPPAGSGWYLAP
jgi:hypothetical protein